MQETAHAPAKTDEHYATWALLGIVASQVDWTVYQTQRLQLDQTAGELQQIADRLRGYAGALMTGAAPNEGEG